jgi:hypothetical protein
MSRVMVNALAWVVMAFGGLGVGNAAQRPVALPDWSGEWELVGLTPHDGGRFVESAAEISARWDRAPYNDDPRQAEFAGPLRAALAAPGRRSPPFLCTIGYPMLMLESPTTFEVLITPHQSTLVFSSREVRNIYTDGRPHTPEDEIWATPWGDSIGHWEGQTLVADTIAVSTPFKLVELLVPAAGAAVALVGTDLADARVPAVFSKQARYAERIRLLKKDLLEVQITVHDPAALSSDWQLTRQFRRIAGVNRMVFQDCEGDTRHDVIDGVTRLRLSE